MENNFDTAKEHMDHFFKTSGHTLDFNAVLLLMTQYAAKFVPGAIEQGGKEAIAALEVEFKTKIAQLEQLLSSKEQAHQEAVTSLQAQLTEANAQIVQKVEGEPEVKATKKTPKA